jgi:hypothetical protein
MNTGKKQENATMAIFDGSPMPKRIRNTGRNAIFGTANRNDTNGSEKFRTALRRPAASPTHTPATVPMANPDNARNRLIAAARGNSPSAARYQSAARICVGYER